LNLVADAYPSPLELMLRLMPVAGEEQPLYLMLNRYLLRGSRWTREGEFFHVRSYTWYNDRLGVVPQAILQQWTARWERHPRIELDDAAALAVSLQNEQLRNLLVLMRERGFWLGQLYHLAMTGPWAGRLKLTGDAWVGRLEMLRAYGSLSGRQRAALAA